MTSPTAPRKLRRIRDRRFKRTTRNRSSIRQIALREWDELPAWARTAGQSR